MYCCKLHAITLLFFSPNRNDNSSGRRRSGVSITRGTGFESGEDGPDYLGESSEADLNKIISMMADKNRDEETINQILQDWKLLAQKVDYVLFWVFLFMTTVSSVMFIFVLPEYNYMMTDKENDGYDG